MAVQIPPTITPVPTPAIQRNDRATFSNRVDAFVTWLITAVTQFGAVATNVYNNAVDAAASATAALANKVLSQSAADAAESYRTQAQASAVAAAASATTIGTTAAFSDANPVVKGSADITKQLKFEVDGFTTGTTRTVTAPNKSGTMALLDDGGLVPVAEIILGSAAANIDFLSVFTSAYDRYLITFENIVASGTSSLQMRYATAGTVDVGTNYSHSAFFSSGSANTSIFVGDVASVVSTPCSGEIIVYDINSSTAHKRGQSICLNTGNLGYSYHNTYSRPGAPAAMSGFRLFILSGATFSAGAKVRVYGYKKA